jgi:rubrerythrin
MVEGHGYDKLKPLTSIREVLETATAFERTARDFYAALIPKVSKNLRYLVEELAEEEQGHVDLFAGWAERADLAEYVETRIKRPASDRRFSDCIQVPDLGEAPDDQTVLQYALTRENAAMEQYTALAAETPPGVLKDLFVALADEETKHKNELEVLYYKVVHSGGV